MTQSHIDKAENYFSFLAKSFPVMCASDEFSFLPRAAQAVSHYDLLEDFHPDGMQVCLHQLRRYGIEFDQLAAKGQGGVETEIDLALLCNSVRQIESALGKRRIWRHDPLLYLKIAGIGLDHAMSKPAGDRRERNDRVCERLNAMPRLLDQAIVNLQAIPESFHTAACRMVSDCRHYVEDMESGLSDDDRIPEQLFTATHVALKKFQKFLEANPPLSDQSFSAAYPAGGLAENYDSHRPLQEIFDIAVEDWHENLAALEDIQSLLGASVSWRDIYHSYRPSTTEETDTLGLYRTEAEQLRHFFSSHGFYSSVAPSPMVVVETPVYLKSVRGTASFGAALTNDIREKSYFYITTSLPRHATREERTLLKKRFHREYKFLSAHETIPGHHMLDTIRRQLSNPIRRQLESALFYEGWACYAESLLFDYDYLRRPEERLVDHKRRLWRAARSQIGVGLHTGLLDRQAAAELLITAGFSSTEADRQINRFQLNPGYQLCYSLGRFEINRLKNEFAGKLDDRQFHSILLEGGELPFHLAEKRMSAIISGD